jgi:hypothetical protein
MAANKKPTVLKKPLRVHIECKTAAGYRWMRQNIREGVPPIGDIDGHVLVVSRPDRFHAMLDAAECKITETLAGAQRRRRRRR